jgi:hypothetical protein
MITGYFKRHNVEMGLFNLVKLGKFVPSAPLNAYEGLAPESSSFPSVEQLFQNYLPELIQHSKLTSSPFVATEHVPIHCNEEDTGRLHTQALWLGNTSPSDEHVQELLQEVSFAHTRITQHQAFERKVAWGFFLSNVDATNTPPSNEWRVVMEAAKEESAQVCMCVCMSACVLWDLNGGMCCVGSGFRFRLL